MAYKNKGSYGGRPWWHWLILYIVIGGLLYLVIYKVYFKNKGYGYDDTAPSSTQNDSNYNY